jgi:hypothetical protein
MQYNVGDLLISSQNRIHTIMSLKEGKHIWTEWFNPLGNGWVNSVFSYRDMREMGWKYYPVIK